jgi:hypothetical protein
MSFTTKKYIVSVSFCRKLTFFGKFEGSPLWILSQNLKIFKARKNLYIGPLCVIDLEFGLHE